MKRFLHAVKIIFVMGLMALANRAIHSSWESGRSRRDIGKDQNIGKYGYIKNIDKYRWIFLQKYRKR